MMSNGPLMAMKIKDRKDVKMLPTVHKSSEVNTGKRDHNDRVIKRCEVVHLYNQFMGAVDRSDQMVAYSSFRRRTIKWWEKVFFSHAQLNHTEQLDCIQRVVQIQWPNASSSARVQERVGQTIGEGGGGHTNGKVKVTHPDLNRSSNEVKWPSFSIQSPTK